MRLSLGYTRDKSEHVISRHITQTSNTIHTSTGSGGNTDCFIIDIYEKDSNQ